jgi:hypothetical protein
MSRREAADIIQMLTDMGWQDDGVVVKQSTYGFRTGIVRKRFHLPNTDRYVTVGSYTVCFYQKDGGIRYGFEMVPTSERDAIFKVAVNGAP